MSRLAVGVANKEERFPRVSGDEPPARSEASSPAWFSPRERG